MLALRRHKVVAFASGEAQSIGALGEAHVGIVLTQKYAILGTRGEHAIWFVHAFGHEVVDKHTYVCFIASEHKGFAAYYILMCIDAGYQALPCRFLITGGTVDLSGKEEVAHTFGFERMLELCGVEKVVFDSISRAIDLQIGKGGNLAQRLELYLPRERRGESVEIHLLGGFAFGLYEKLVFGLIGKCHYLGFDAGTIARTYRLYLAIK